MRLSSAAHAVFINVCKYLDMLKKEWKTKKDHGKKRHYVQFRVIFSFDELLVTPGLKAFEFWLKHESEASEAWL